MVQTSVFRERRDLPAFALGCLAVTVGGLLHLPMYLMGADDGFKLADMPMDAEMLVGMGLIVVGIAVAAYGLLPKKIMRGDSALSAVAVAAPEDAPLAPAHWGLMAVLTVALIIDVMKPASLGFVMPGLVSEYGVPKMQAALVPFFALTGTVVGSVLWGIIADLYGRKASILLSAVVFVGTSICGAMPSLEWNIFMCFIMGAGAGGMLPVTYACRDDAVATSRLGPGARRRAWRRRRLFRSKRFLRTAGAGLFLAHSVVPQPAHRADPHPDGRADTGVGQVPAGAGPHRGGEPDHGAFRDGHPKHAGAGS
jgi:MFS transporter, putative metabolite:H+ symporter